MIPFAAVLTAVRSSRGCASARSFYKAAGGRRALGCTYRAFLDIEAGRALPKPALALRLARALGLGGPAARPLAIAYLREATGSAELTALLLGSLGPRGAEQEESLFRRAAEMSFAQRSRPLTKEECELICADAPTYWCFTALSNDRTGQPASALARSLGFGPAAVKRALARLERLGLARRDKDGRWRCPWAGAVFTFPRDRLFIPRYREALTRLWSGMARRRGAPAARSAVRFKADETVLRRCLPALGQAVYGAHIYSRRDGGADSAFYVLDAVVREERG